MKSMPKLASLLFETPEEDLSNFMSTPLKVHGANPIENLPDDAKQLVKKPTGSDDKKIKGGVSKGGGTPISVSKLLASQNEVGKKQSLSNVCKGVNATWDGINWGDPKWLMKAMKPGAIIRFSNPLLGAKTSDGSVVLDGHHRWSQAFMVNPSCKVNVVFANASSLSADQTLKAVHLAILAKTDQSNTKSAEGGNLFEATPEDVIGYFDQAEVKVDHETGAPSTDGIAPYIYAVMQLKGIKDPNEGKKEAVSKIMDAISKCSSTVVSGAPSRDSMPQADGDSDKPTNSITAKAVMTALNKGEVNYSPPYVKGEKSKAPEEELVSERWLKLAGLIK